MIDPNSELTEKLRVFKTNVDTVWHSEYEDRFKKIPEPIKKQLRQMLELLETEHAKPPDQAAAEEELNAELQGVKLQNEHLANRIKELEAELAELQSGRFERNDQQQSTAITEQSKAPSHHHRQLAASRHEARDSTGSSDRPRTHKSNPPATSVQQKSKPTWPASSGRSHDRRKDDASITVLVLKPKVPTEFNAILNETRKAMLKYKGEVTFAGVGPSGLKREKIVVKFENSTREREMLDDLRLLNAEVWKFENTRRIMITQIDKWLPDSDILEDVATSNSIDMSKIKLERVINNPQFNTKRAIMKIDDQLLATLQDRPGRCASKLNVGFRLVPFKVLAERDPADLVCHHCKQPGHRGYRLERSSTPDSGVTATEREWTLVCQNMCDQCETVNNVRQCTAEYRPRPNAATSTSANNSPATNDNPASTSASNAD